MSCALAPFSEKPCEYRADGQPDRGHWIPKQRLKAAGIEDVWAAPLWGHFCRSHHHLLDAKFLRLDESSYPASLHEWATENGWYWAGEREGWRAEHREAA